MKTKERILQFIDYKGLSKRKFCEGIKLSHTIFNNNSALGSDKLELIFSIYPELNMDWVITGRGEMILKPGAENNEWREKYYECLEKYNACLEGKKDIEHLGKTA